MFGRTPKAEDIRLDVVMNKILDELDTYSPETEEWKKAFKYLEKIVKLRKTKVRRVINLDNVILVVGNLFGILVIVAYEQKHVFTSKGQGFILKPKPTSLP